MQRMRQAPSLRRPAFPGCQTALMAPAGEAAISVTRFRPQIVAGREHVAKMTGEEAFVVLYQLRDHPAHEFKLDGRLERPDAARRGTLNIIDLRLGDACGRLLHPVDTLMFHVPVHAIEHVVDDADAATISGLRAPDPWRTTDPLVDQLAPVLVEALATPEAEVNGLLNEHLLLGLGAHFVRRYGGVTSGHRPARGGLAAWQERRALEMLDDASGRPASIREIAQALGLSPDHFTRAFRASTGQTPHGWLQARRIARAKDLLLRSELPISQIAQACGFADQSHFSRTFLRQTGESPFRWRRGRA